jgi:hypothetical protein
VVGVIAAIVGINSTNVEVASLSYKTPSSVIVAQAPIDYSGKLLAMTEVPDIFDELLGKKIPSFTYMLYVATCETEQNWQNSGQYAGGFGFMHKSKKVHKDYAAVQSTWLQWGGAEFAKRPQDATSKEQALIWIRTYTTGWTRPNGVFKPPAHTRRGVPSSNCHDDLKIGLHTYKGEAWPVSDNWKLGDPQIKPWDK